MVDTFFHSTEQLLRDTKTADEGWRDMKPADKILYLKPVVVTTVSQSDPDSDDEPPRPSDGELAEEKAVWKKVQNEDGSTNKKEAIKYATEKYMRQRSDALAFALVSGMENDNGKATDGLLKLGEKLGKFANDCPMKKMETEGCRPPCKDEDDHSESWYV